MAVVFDILFLVIYSILFSLLNYALEYFTVEQVPESIVIWTCKLTAIVAILVPITLQILKDVIILAARAFYTIKFELKKASKEPSSELTSFHAADVDIRAFLSDTLKENQQFSEEVRGANKT
jgi:hypothetical protein